MNHDFVEVDFAGKHPTRAIVRAIVEATQIDGVLTTAHFIRSFGKFFRGISSAWMNPPRNFYRFADRKSVDLTAAVDLVTMAHVCGVDLRITVHEDVAPFDIPGGNIEEFLAAPEHYVLHARSKLRDLVKAAL